ncbi:MAG: HYR domain-containing protein [Fluviicola sp.]|nr:HYR domain-containing protein [Fluviicola sp.]
MKTIVSLMFALMPFLAIFAQDGISQAQMTQNLESGKILYQENKGQIVDTKGDVRPDVLFTAFSKGVRTYFKKGGISYVFEKHNGLPESPVYTENGEVTNEVDMEEQMKNYTVEMHRIDLNFIGANLNAEIVKENPTRAFDNFYLGHCKVSNVQSFNKVTYRDIYPNIDMVLYTKEGGMKYDFIVHPGGNPNDIQIEVDGTDDYSINENGELYLGSHLGRIVEGKPYTFQSDLEITSSYTLNDGVLAFKVDNYNKNEDLIIDPTREWGTYYTAGGGGVTWNWGYSVSSNANGAFMVINTSTSTYPVSAGVFDPTYNGSRDLRIAHFNTAGALIWGTYIGGSGGEAYPSIAANNNQLVISCATSSGNYPFVSGFDATPNGSWDFALSKFNSTNGSIVWSTYYGGSGVDWYSTAVDINTAGEVAFVGGYTTSNNIPLVSPFDAVNNGRELVIAKFSNGGGLMWSSYLAGNCGLVKGVSDGGVEFSPNGNIAVLTLTSGNCFTGTAGVFDPTYNGNMDYFLFNIAGNGSGVNYGTWIGNGNRDGLTPDNARTLSAMAVCSDNSVIIGGTNFDNGNVSWAATPGSYSTANGPTRASYVIKFNTLGQRVWGTTWTGSNQVWMNDIAVDEADNVFIMTSVPSASLPVTVDNHQTYAGNWDKHIGQLSADGTTLLYGTYLGTSGYDLLENGSLDYSNGALYVNHLTNTNSSNPAWIVSAGAYQINATGGSYFPVLNKFQFCTPTTLTLDLASLPDVSGQCAVTPATPTATNDCGTVINGTPDVTLPITTQGATTITWTFDDGVTTITQTQNVIVSGPNLQTVSPLTQTICNNTSATIDLLSSEVGFNYFLRDDTNDTIIAGPVAGTGGAISFNTGNLSVNMDYNVYAESSTTASTALQFDGVDEFVNINGQNALDFDNTDAFTIEAWINSNTGGVQSIVSKLDINTLSHRGYEMWLNGNNLQFYLINTWPANSINVATNTNPITSGAWHHVAVTYDGSSNANGVTIYIDGVAQAVTIGNNTLSASTLNATVPVNIGRRPLENIYPFNGTIDEVRIWGEERTGADVVANMSSCLTGSEANLRAYYQFEDGTGSATTADLGPNALTGTLTNMETATDWVAGANVCSSCNSAMAPISSVVIDNVNPTAVCQNITIQLDAAGNATIVPADIDGGSSDFCPIVLTASQLTFDCTNVGANTVTLTVTDDNGNFATCDATVTVEDNVPPVAICQPVTVQLDATGNATITVADINNGSSDICGIAGMSLTPSSFNCTNVGANTVTLTVTDVNGNISTCTSTVTVEDNIAPTAICQPFTAVLDATGNVIITTADINNGSSDNCGIASMTLDITTFNCTNIGANPVTLTVTDVNGNVSTCTATVTVEDNITPNAICQNITVQLDATGNATIVNTDINNGSSDNCGIASMALDITTFDCSNIGANPVTLTVTDVNGNVSTCTATVTVEDNTAPTAICQPFTAVLDATGNVTITTADINNGSSDNCGIASMALDITTFNCTNVGVNTVILTVTDVNGNVSTCTSTVTVQDNIAPTAICQPFTAVLDATGNVTITTADINNGSSDNCGIASMTLDITSFNCTNVGANNVTLTVTDDNGNISTCTSTVTVEDNIAPTAICQPFTAVLDATGNVTITTADINNGSSDNCGIASMTLDITSFNCTNVGTNTVTLTVTDNNGNVSTCTSTVTVVDNINPTAICQDFTVVLDATGNAAITTADINNGSSDNCGIASLALDKTTFNCANVGLNTVILTVTDDNGNVSTCTSTVTVQDNTNPTAICQNITVALDAVGMASIVASDIDNGSNDICGIASTTIDVSNFDCSNVGPNIVTLTVTDNNGNISTCTSTVTIIDIINPLVTCPADITLDAVLDNCGRVVLYNMVSVDNCGTTVTQTDGTGYTSGDLFPVGTTLQSFDITDPSGNTVTCSFNVTIVDNQNPDITGCPANITVNNTPGLCQANVSWIQPTASDNCPGVVFTTTNAPGTVFPLGVTTVTYTAVDNAGNTVTCSFDVTVIDNEAPVIVDCGTDINLDTDSGLCSATNPGLTPPTITENCTMGTITNNAPATFPLGATVVTWTVTDAAGNVSTCAQNVIVTDNEAPLAICQSITVQLDATGNVSIIPADINNGSNDACGIASTTIDISTFDCSNVGPNTVTLTVTDNNGNVSTCTSVVTVEDNVAPVAMCQPFTAQLDASGNVTITGADIDGGSTDACGVASLVASPNTFTCAEVGANTVTLTVTDVNGNVSTCTSTVTVEDNVAPTAICQDIIVQLDATGNVIITGTDIDGGSTDACGIASVTASPNTFTCAEVGPNTVTLTVTDNNGNISTCTSTVTVEDNVAPVAMCQPITVQLDATGNVSIVAGDIDAGSNDACGIVSTTIDMSTFDCSNVGANTVTLTVTDVNGNTSTCTSTVTVEDNVAPVAICQPITVQLDATGNAIITAADIDNGSNDACGIATTTIDISTFDCSNVGPNTVTLTVTDVNGNVSTCTSIVTVEDNVAPTVICQDITVYLDGSGTVMITGADIDNGSIDACGIASFVASPNVFTCAETGANTVTLTVTDLNGNVSTCTSTVTVLDTIVPVITCPADIVVSNDAGICGALVNFNVTATDNCGTGLGFMEDFETGGAGWTTGSLGAANNWTIQNTSGAGTSFGANSNMYGVPHSGQLGWEYSYLQSPVFNSTGGGAFFFDFFVNNESATWDQEIVEVSYNGGATWTQVIGTQLPNSSATVQTTNFTIPGASGTVNTMVRFVYNTIDGCCGPLDGFFVDNILFGGASAITIVSSTPSGSVFPVGTTTVTTTATDPSGNSSSCTFDVTVNDTEAPIASCQDITVQLNAAGNASITVADVNIGSTDNCGIASTSIDVTTFDCSNVGPNTVTLTVTDIYGNVSTCTSTVTVEDNIAPIALCQSLTLQLDATGNASILVSDIDAGSTDACGIASTTIDISAFDCTNVGTNTITLTVTDNNGNISTCTSTVTVEDNVAPTAICQSITVQLDATGNVLITPADVDNGSSDACGIASTTIDISAFDCSNVGPNTVTLTVTDVNGNVSTCTSIVTVEDNIAPTAICQNIDVYLDASGNASIIVGDINNGSFDNCAIATTTIDITTFDCSNVGPNTVTLTVTDVNGNVSTCTSTVTVIDNIPPTITCPVDVIVSADPGVCDASFVAFGTATVTDNCAVASLTNDAPAVFPLGNTIVTWTAIDVNGNTLTCAQTVTVIDSENPVITCPADIIVSTDAGSCDATGVALGMATATDNCSVNTITNDAPAVFPLGNTNVTWTATDFEGNVITCTQVVTVIDSEIPTITCPSDVIVGNDFGICGALGVALGTPVTTDNCTIASVTNDAPLSYPLGNTTVTWTVTDAAGNVATCTQIVTVNDTEAPTIVCPANITVSNDAGTCDATGVALGTELTFDNCAVASVTNDAPATFPLGNTTVTWTVTDAAGNSSTCTQVVTVVDTEIPTITCPLPITLSADAGSCDATNPSIGMAVGNDNCSVASVTNDAPTTFPLGMTVVTWTVTDDAGNTATCTQNVTIIDTEMPTIVCPADYTASTAGGSCDVTGISFGTPTVNDNCMVASVTNDAPVTFPLGTTVVTWTVTDAAGNTATCMQNVIVEDNEAPTINCPANVLVTADAGVCDASGVALGMATGSDNCTVASITNDAPATFPLGTTTVTWTVTDAAGNTATCTQDVTVTDNELPTITCPTDITITADAGVCESASVVLGTPITADNCSVASITNDAPAIFPLGSTTVTWTVTDGSGNIAMCTQNVTVTDNEMPTIVCEPAVIVSSDAGVCTAVVALVTPATSDNCSVASVTSDSPGIFPLGTTTVTWTVVDGSGNTVTCTQDVTVEDNELPTIVCPATLTVSTDPMACEATGVALGTPITNDNCSVASVTNDAPVAFQLGITTVTWTVIDGSGNTVTCTQDVEVIDTEAPSLICVGDITVNNVPGNCGRVVNYTLPTVVDNCSITAMTQTDGTGLTSGSWFPIGVSLQEYTVTDPTGNTFSCSFTVTVVDNEAPVIEICPANMVVYSDANTCDMNVFFGTPIASDNCPGVTYTSTFISGEVFPLGITAVTYDAIDAVGNIAQCTFTIEVIDTISPVAPVLATVEGGCAVTLPVPTAVDNCSGSILGTTTTVFPVTALGITPIVWIFTDGSGNVSTTTQYISIDGTVDATVSVIDGVTFMSNNNIATYQWIDCATGFPIAGETNQTFVATINGSYAVELTEVGCTPVISNCYTVAVVGLEDVSFAELTIFPNPSTNGLFTIEYDGQIEKITMIDMVGRYIKINIDLDNLTIDASELASGKYMLHIVTENGVIGKEVIIIK